MAGWTEILTVRRLSLVVTSALFAIPLWSAVTLPWPAATVVAIVLTVTLWKPNDGLLIVAGLLPLAAPIGRLLGLPFDSLIAGELLLLPFLTAACARRAWRLDSGSDRLTPGVVASVAIIVAAICVGLAPEPGAPATVAVRCWHHATTTYFAGPVQCVAVHDGMIWLEGLLLAWCAATIAGSGVDTASRTVRTLIAGAVAASLVAVETIVETFLRQPSTHDALAVLGATRIGIHMPDVNAVGSMYALFVVPAFWLACSRPRWWTWLGFISIAVALWASGSRAAVASACFGVWLVAALGGRFRVRTLAFGAALAVAVVGVSLARFSGEWMSIGDAFQIRVHMARIGLAIATTHPAFGVGLGQFPVASRPLITDDFLALFPRAVDGENSHNNLVQFLAEFGVVGTLALMSVIVYPVLRVATAIREGAAPPDGAILVGGLTAFLMTCVTGHPFLLPLCVWLYFLTTGLAAGIVPERPRRSPPWGAWMAGGCVALTVLSVHGRAAEARSAAATDPALAPGPAGETGSLDGVDYTMVTRSYSMYVDPRARSATVALRRTPDSAFPCPVMISVNFRRADVVEPPVDAWLRTRYVLHSSTVPTAGRIDLLLRATNCRIRVGQLVVE
jgi:O-antigen ligase